MKFHETVNQRKNYLENEDFLGERKRLLQEQHFYRSNATEKTVINETKLLKTLTKGSTE